MLGWSRDLGLRPRPRFRAGGPVTPAAAPAVPVSPSPHKASHSALPLLARSVGREGGAPPASRRGTVASLSLCCASRPDWPCDRHGGVSLGASGLLGGSEKLHGCRQAPVPLWASQGWGDRGSGIFPDRDSPRVSKEGFEEDGGCSCSRELPWASPPGARLRAWQPSWMLDLAGICHHAAPTPLQPALSPNLTTD